MGIGYIVSNENIKKYMIRFVNAKLNLGLDIVRKREDGYHDLETVFYPVGVHNGTPRNPEPFCDILEITPADETEFIMSGREVDCALEKNLVFKAWQCIREAYELKTGIAFPDYRIHLEKHLPDGAGLGGGSADASFTLTMLNELAGNPFSKDELESLALRLGADCPFFIRNKACYAEGVGEKMTDVNLDLSGIWCVLVKPDLNISTKEAFAGVIPRLPEQSLRDSISLPISEWQGKLKNDFESSLFPNHLILADIKSEILESGAEYAAMSGSGSTIFGLFSSEQKARKAHARFSKEGTLYSALCLL